MRRVFADAFFYLALVNPRDRAYGKAREWAAKTDLACVTTEFVLLEVADALSAPTARRQSAAFLRTLRQDPCTRIISLSSGLLQEGLRLYEERTDKSWTLTDCTSFVAMRQEGLTEALTADQHFAQAGYLPLL
ncbi:MAG: PIN domain-containing protein [Candidatus Sumerlaeota bacterium]|nr:PIN domain-containing protein [Candidatus Sumerlaeota bacterium]